MTHAELERRIKDIERRCCCADEVKFYDALADFPDTGVIDKIYVDETTDLLYRWDGAVYVLIAGGPVVWGDIGGTLSNQTDLQNALNAKQATLVSGTNIKTINSTSLLGAGDIAITSTPAGSDREIQFNNAGAFGASSTLMLTTDNVLRSWPTTVVVNDAIVGGNNAFYAIQDATSANTVPMIGAYALNRGAGASMGVVGFVDNQAGTGIKVGIMGRVANTEGSTATVGGYFNLTSTWTLDPPTITEQVALMADNGATTGSIFIARDNGTAVFTIKNGGILNIVHPVYADDTAAGAGGLAAGDHYQTSAGVVMVKQ